MKEQPNAKNVQTKSIYYMILKGFALENRGLLGHTL
jgi:hypothetical protein